MKNTKKTPEGQGHKATVKVDFAMKLEVDGEPVTDVKGSYDFSMQFESIEYVVQGLAASVARVATKIAEPDKKPDAIA